MKPTGMFAIHGIPFGIRFPVLLLATLLQRTPAINVLSSAEGLITGTFAAAVLKAAVATLGSLGAVHSLAGATVLVASAASPATATVGEPITPIGFTVSNTIQIAAWNLGGSLPPGLKLTAVGTDEELTGPGLLSVIIDEEDEDDGYGGGGGISHTVPLLVGTPTHPGNYTFTLQAHQGPLGFVSDTFSYTMNVVSSGQVNPAPTFTSQPSSHAAGMGASVILSTSASGSPTFQWRHNGVAVPGVTGSTLTLSDVKPADAGIYIAVGTNSGGTATSRPAILGVATTSKVIGAGTEIAADIPHPNTNIFDQILLEGPAAAFTADAGQVTRLSYIDLNDDIVQIEFSGAGAVSIVLDGASGPAVPAKYTQPSVSYMKGHAGIIVTGANETTNLSVFTVGRATAFDPTGGYNILQAPGAANNPANNGSPLFVGQGATSYDGLADIAFVAILSTNGRFGGLRTANASYWATKGVTGVYAPGVEFTGPVFVGDIVAMLDATPHLQIGSAGVEVRITGGNLQQENGRAVQVSGITPFFFRDGSTSHGTLLAAKPNQAVLMHNGSDVTSEIVVNPAQ